MAWQILIENKEDLDLLASLFAGSVRKIRSGTTKFSDESAEQILKLYESIENARECPDPEPEAVDPDPKAGQAKTKPKGKGAGAKSKRTREPKFRPNLCSDHPDNAMVRPPRTSCSGCWEAYRRMNPTKYDVARRDFDRRERVKAETANG